jgi:hypothetical protein
MMHVATAFKTGSVQLDKNSGFSGTLGKVSDHYDDVVDVAGKAAGKGRDLAAHAGAFEGAANTIAKVLDGAASLADGIPVASFVLKGVSFIVNQVQGLKFDARMNRMIQSLFPDLSPTKWTSVVEQVARRVTVTCASDIEALYSGTEDDRGRVKNWFRSKCSEYGLATLTSKADDAVVMMALQKVEAVSQLALGQTVPSDLDEEGLADFIVEKLAPSASFPSAAASAAAPAPAPAPHSTTSSGRSSSPPPSALHDAASHSEVEQLRKELEEQKEREKKREQELAAMRKQMQKLSAQDKDKDASGSGGGLVLASSKSEVNADAVNTAAAQAVRPVQQQVVRMQHHVQELTAFITSHSDPVLKSHLENLNNAAVPVMKKHRDILGNRWHDRFIAVRNATLFYADTPAAATKLAASHSRAPGDEHVIELKGCRVEDCAMETDGSHWAFKLHTPQVMVQGD